jgi:hypothetical protein
MSEPLLEYDDTIGFCTMIETTKSRLFTSGCDATADTDESGSFWFRVSIPRQDSAEFDRLQRLIQEHQGHQRVAAANLTPALIEVRLEERIANRSAQQQAELAHSLTNRFLRAYEHTYFDLLVPRHRLDGRTIVLIAPDSHRCLDYVPVVLDLHEVLDSYLPAHMDVEGLHLSILMGSPHHISPSWRILVDGARHFESGNLREAVLCACSAAEITAVPAVEEWLTKNTMERDTGAVRNAVREMGNPLRFELCIAGACTNAFAALDQTVQADLLSELRRMNSLRNSVVHQGTEPDADAAAAALRAAASFVCQVWLASF